MFTTRHPSVDKCIETLIEGAQHYGVSQLAAEVIDCTEFHIWSGSSRPELHHYGDHGLIVHTCEVIQTCFALRKLYDLIEVSEKNLFLAGLFHDFGKIKDYCLNDDLIWGPAPHKYLIHHINESAIFWNGMAARHKVLQVDYEEVTHAILSHHGRPEWGSPIKPQTKLAWVLHLSDMCSSHFTGQPKGD